MEKADFYNWLEQKRARLCDLIYAYTEAGSRAESTPMVDLRARVETYVGRMLDYLRTGDPRIMIQQIEDTNRKKLARGEELDYKSAEKQEGYILAAFSQLMAESNIDRADRERFYQQIQRSLQNFTATAKMVYSRLILEQAQAKSNE